MAERVHTMAETWRAKIQTANILNRLEKCASGEIEMTPNQIKANEILLKRALPELKAVEHSGDVKMGVTIQCSPLDEKI